MKTRRSAATRAALEFEALSIEGSLLSPPFLERIARQEAPFQADADYRIPRGLSMRDEIGRYWRMAQSLWQDFRQRRANLSHPGDPRHETAAIAFVRRLLKECLGFSSLEPLNEPLTAGSHEYPVGHAALSGRVPVVIAPPGRLSDPLPQFGEGGRRRSALALLQEALNARGESLWGIACDGLRLRLLRDNASLTRPAWVEADLERIFTEERYADFTALWLLLHESRFGRPDAPEADSPLEAWHSASRSEGVRARDQLRHGVKKTLHLLGEGFLSHPANDALRNRLASGELTVEEYFHQLLRLAYRFIFLLTAEERGLLHAPDASPGACALYRHYALSRLRERCLRRFSLDTHGDAWEGVRVVFAGLGDGGIPQLGLPHLGGLFDPSQCPDLDSSRLDNRHLLEAFFHLAWLRDEDRIALVNWRDMDTEELGSVYESLLELMPSVALAERTFTLTEAAAARGGERKTTGSYYTPDSLVQVLLDEALEPVIAERVAQFPENPADALLDLRVVDPACGSGHFLLAAARRLALHIARLRSGEGTPSEESYRHALRQVAAHCLYGVDLNPLAVELCRTSLWMETMEPGKPLSFLDAHIRVGNALVGAPPDLLERGIPDEAWETLTGDDRKTAAQLKKRNRQARTGRPLTMDSLWQKKESGQNGDLLAALQEFESVSEEDAHSAQIKRQRYEELRARADFSRRLFLADAWCAAFFWPKTPGEAAIDAPTQDLWGTLAEDVGRVPPFLASTVAELARKFGFFHWHLEFPQVFFRGGFSCVLGNPPWEKLKVAYREFFAARAPEIATIGKAAEAEEKIAALEGENPHLFRQWHDALRAAEGQTLFLRESGLYPLCGRGDVNTYAVFAERARTLLAPDGRAGLVVPSGIAMDDTTKAYFQALVDTRTLSALYDFENKGLFPDVHSSYKFSLLAFTGNTPVPAARLAFFLHDPAQLREPERRIELSAEAIALVNPNTRTCPVFRTRRDANLTLSIYERVPVLVDETRPGGNPWDISFSQGLFNMATDSRLFVSPADLRAQGFSPDGSGFSRKDERYVPLYEAKMVHQFDHRFASWEGADTVSPTEAQLRDPFFFVRARHYVPAGEVERRLAGRTGRGYLLGWRDICRSTDERTVISAVIPRVGVGHKFPLFFTPFAQVFSLYANLNAFVLDYVARQKIGGTNMTYFYFKQLPVLAPAAYEARAPWAPGQTVGSWIAERVLELTYTTWDLSPLARDLGFSGPPFAWDPERRFDLRCQMDAAFFILYGLSRADAAYVLDTFPIVRRNDEKTHGTYRTRERILEWMERLA